jgi:hypothetical protein
MERTCSCSDEWHAHHEKCFVRIKSPEQEIAALKQEVEGWKECYKDLQGDLQGYIDKKQAEAERLQDHISEHLNAQNTGSLILARHYEPNELVYFDGAALDSGDNGGCLYLYRLKKLEADR